MGVAVIPIATTPPAWAAVLYAEIGVTCGGQQCEHAFVLDYHLRTATAEDARFLADVVFEATRALEGTLRTG